MNFFIVLQPFNHYTRRVLLLFNAYLLGFDIPLKKTYKTDVVVVGGVVVVVVVSCGSEGIRRCEKHFFSTESHPTWLLPSFVKLPTSQKMEKMVDI